jgi:hypothetical protein
MQKQHTMHIWVKEQEKPIKYNMPANFVNLKKL